MNIGDKSAQQITAGEKKTLISQLSVISSQINSFLLNSIFIPLFVASCKMTHLFYLHKVATKFQCSAE